MLARRADMAKPVAAALAGWLFACIEPEPPQPVAFLSAAPESAVVYVDSTITLTATPFDRDGRPLTGRAVGWVSYDTTIAAVAPSGIMRGMKVGATRIAAASESVWTSIPATVVVSYQGVATGGWMSCGLALSGHPYCWGFEQSSPELVPGGLTYRSITAGDWHVCGVTESDTAYCHSRWYFPALGGGPCGTWATPCRVAGGLGFEMLSAGHQFTCGVTTAGAAYCWGLDYFGQLGVGGQPDLSSDVPVPVAGGLAFRAVTAGYRHACGITTAGEAYCWGYNRYGALGALTPDPTCEHGSCSRVPVPVTGGLTFRSLSAGLEFTCGVTPSDEVYCWGDNWAGTLGLSGVTSCHRSRTGDANYPCSETPVRAAGDLRFVAVDAGWSHACGLASDGQAYCWGDNSAGALGEPSAAGGPVPVPVWGGHRFRSLDASYDHTCGLSDSGLVYCWGSDWSQVLGNGAGGSSRVPSRVLFQR